jgi:hypothetical protein
MGGRRVVLRLFRLAVAVALFAWLVETLDLARAAGDFVETALAAWSQPFDR